MKKRTMQYRGKTIYLAKFDVIFKAIFVSDGDYTLLASLLSSILGIPIEAEDITVLNVELAPEHRSGRLSRLDVRVKTADNKHINIEIQLVDEKNMDKRSIFYLSKLYTQQMTAKMKFHELGQAITINILDFDYLPYEEYHNVYRLKNIANNDELTNALEIHFIELKKMPRDRIGSQKDFWMKFISAENEEALDMLAKQNEVMDKAVKKLVYVSSDELIRYEMDMREKIELDYYSAMQGSYDEGIAIGEERGIAIGEERGREANIREVVLEMKNDGLSEERIARIVKLPIEDVRGILYP